MDNITHTLTAILMSRAGLNRLAPHATLLLVVGANAPDLDVVAAVAGPGAYLEYHRGASHSLAAIPVLALLLTALVFLIMRRRSSGRASDRFPSSALRNTAGRPQMAMAYRTYIVALIGVASNPIFDLANSYGVRLLWPFTRRWVNADFLAVYDVWIWIFLLLGLVAPWFSRLVSSEIGAKGTSGRGMAVLALCLVGVYCSGRYMLHARAVSVLDSRLYQGEVPIRVAAMPGPFNPLRWTGLVEGSRFMARYPGVNLLEEFNPGEGQIYFKAEPSPDIARARELESFRAFLGWAQWPLWRTVPSTAKEPGIVVELSDLRFGEPWNSPMKVTSASATR